MILDILTTPLFLFFITVAVYLLFAYLVKRFKTALFNPLLWTIIVMVGYLVGITAWKYGNLEQANIEASVGSYRGSANIFEILLGPVTVALAIPLYEHRQVLKDYWLAILVATIVGTSTSVGSVFLFGHILQLDQTLVFALLPRGVTTAIATEIATMLGAEVYVPITVSIVALTGIVGATVGPLLIKLFRDDSDTVVGLSLGSASHAIGTSKAFDYSSKAGAIASVSIVTNGLFTVIVALVINMIMNAVG